MEDQTPNRKCSNCDADISGEHYEYDTDSGLRTMYCDACGTTTVEEGAGARMDRMAQGESLDEIHDNLSESVREAISEAAPPKVEDTLVTYVDSDGNETTVNTAEIVEKPDDSPDTCAFPNCGETDDLQLKEGTGMVCDTHYDILTTDFNDEEERIALRNRQVGDEEWRATPSDEE